MEILNKINKLQFKDSVDLLPTVYAMHFVFSKPSTERVFFTLGSPDTRSLLKDKRAAFAGSIEIINEHDLKDGDSFRVLCPENHIYIVTNAIFLCENQKAIVQTIMADDIKEVI